MGRTKPQSKRCRIKVACRDERPDEYRSHFWKGVRSDKETGDRTVGRGQGTSSRRASGPRDHRCRLGGGPRDPWPNSRHRWLFRLPQKRHPSQIGESTKASCVRQRHHWICIFLLFPAAIVCPSSSTIPQDHLSMNPSILPGVTHSKQLPGGWKRGRQPVCLLVFVLSSTAPKLPSLRPP